MQGGVNLLDRSFRLSQPSFQNHHILRHLIPFRFRDRPASTLEIFLVCYELVTNLANINANGRTYAA